MVTQDLHCLAPMKRFYKENTLFSVPTPPFLHEYPETWMGRSFRPTDSRGTWQTIPIWRDNQNRLHWVTKFKQSRTMVLRNDTFWFWYFSTIVWSEFFDASKKVIEQPDSKLGWHHQCEYCKTTVHSFFYDEDGFSEQSIRFVWEGPLHRDGWCLWVVGTIPVSRFQGLAKICFRLIPRPITILVKPVRACWVPVRVTRFLCHSSRDVMMVRSKSVVPNSQPSGNCCLFESVSPVILIPFLNETTPIRKALKKIRAFDLETRSCEVFYIQMFSVRSSTSHDCFFPGQFTYCASVLLSYPVFE